MHRVPLHAALPDASAYLPASAMRHYACGCFPRSWERIDVLELPAANQAGGFSMGIVRLMVLRPFRRRV